MTNQARKSFNNWYDKLDKSQLTPPKNVFRIVWPILYTLMIISLIIIWNNKKCRPYCSPLNLFFIQLVINLFWTTIFFKLKLPKLALIMIVIILIFSILTFLTFYDISKMGSYLLIPYIMWLLFALYLNVYIVVNN